MLHRQTHQCHLAPLYHSQYEAHFLHHRNQTQIILWHSKFLLVFPSWVESHNFLCMVLVIINLGKCVWLAKIFSLNSVEKGRGIFLYCIFGIIFPPSWSSGGIGRHPLPSLHYCNEWTERSMQHSEVLEVHFEGLYE